MVQCFGALHSGGLVFIFGFLSFFSQLFDYATPRVREIPSSSSLADISHDLAVVWITLPPLDMGRNKWI